MPNTPHTISGKTYGADGSTSQSGIFVGARNLRTDEFITNNAINKSAGNGDYAIDIANMTTQWQNADPIDIFGFSGGATPRVGQGVAMADNVESSATLNMSTFPLTYATPADIANMLQIAGFIMTSRPTIARIGLMILQAEDMIDNITNHAWRTRYNATSTGKASASADYEYHTITFPYKYHTGIAIHLKRRKIKTMSASSGDALELFTGSSYEDWIATKTEGRANDFWFDYNLGILYIRSTYWWGQPLKVRIKYRYGESSVPEDIRRITTMLVASELITSEDRAVLVTETGYGMSLADKARMWREQAMEELQRFVEIGVPIEINR